MISAEKAREKARVARLNIYDEQLRMLFEDITEASSSGKMSFSIQSFKLGVYDYEFWFQNAKQNTAIWEKLNKTLGDLGYTVSYTILKFDDERITVSW